MVSHCGFGDKIILAGARSSIPKKVMPRQAKTQKQSGLGEERWIGRIFRFWVDGMNLDVGERRKILRFQTQESGVNWSIW